MTRKRLQWLAIISPTLTIAVIVFTHNLWHRYAYSFSWFHLVVLGVVFLTAYLFTLFVFQAMDRLERTVRQRNQEVAILQERDRLAKEVHDGLGQVLGLLALKASATQSLVTRGQVAQAGRELQEMERVAKQAQADAWDAILGQRSSVGLDRGVARSLAEYVNTFRRESGIDTQLVIPSDLRPLPPAVEVQLLRITQEALTNVRKHARASRAWVVFTAGANWTKVVVEDNGQGFGPAQVRAKGGYGLQSIKEKAEAMGGKLCIESSPQGTTVEVELPV